LSKAKYPSRGIFVAFRCYGSGGGGLVIGGSESSTTGVCIVALRCYGKMGDRNRSYSNWNFI